MTSARPRGDFTFRRLRYFVVVGESGSVSAAAEILRVSSPSISAAIIQLEEELGLQLFARRRMRGMALTSGGRRIFAEAKKLLKYAGNLRDIADDLTMKVAGSLHVGCLRTVAPALLPPLRRSFEAAFPGVRFFQTEDHHAGLLVGLQNADLDLCLTYDLEAPSDIRFEPLAAYPPYVMLPPSHRLAGRRKILPEELAAEPMIMLDMPVSENYFLSMFQSAGIKPNIIERSKDMALVLSMVANGFGYSLGNIRPRPQCSHDGLSLAYVPLKGGLRPLRLGLMFCRSDYETRAAAAFESHCRRTLGKSAPAAKK